MAWKKAILLEGGKIRVPPGLLRSLDARGILSRSKAGPGAGGCSINLGLSRQARAMRARLAVTGDNRAEFSLARGAAGKFTIMRRNRPFISGVDALQKIAHSPMHAFFTTEPRCIFRCAFCSTPLVKGPAPGAMEIIRRAGQAIENGSPAVAFTCGAFPSEEKSVRSLSLIIRGVRKKHPGIPIGAEPYATSGRSIRMLRRAGADEIKINIQSSDRRIFTKICPGMDYDRAWRAARVAAEVFGRGRVCSNIIIGLGETDRSVLAAVRRLARLGVVATLRPVSVNSRNAEMLKAAGVRALRPGARRMVSLARRQKAILSGHGLSAAKFRTMCHACACCDLVPGCDL